VALRFGGYLDTIIDGVTGVYFDKPAPEDIATAVRTMLGLPWDESVLREHALPVFIEQLRTIAFPTESVYSMTRGQPSPAPQVSLARTPGPSRQTISEDRR
jgi:glycogen synthase